MEFELFSLIISSIVGVLSILVSMFVGISVVLIQVKNSRKLAKLESDLKKSGRIFEDKYSRTASILNKLWECRNQIDFYRDRSFNSFTKEDRINGEMEQITKFAQTRNETICLAESSRYWLGSDLFEICKNITEITFKIAEELKKKFLLNQVLLGKTADTVNPNEPFSLKVFDTMVDEFDSYIQDFEDIFIKEYNEK